MSEEEEMATDAELEALLKRVTAEDRQLEDPPAEVWAGISRQITSTKRGRRRWTWVAVPIAAAIAAFVFIGPASEEVLASADLSAEGLPAGPEGLTGAARLIERDGQLLLVVDLDPPPSDGFLELWLLDAEASRLISLGVFEDGRAYPLPPGIDVGEFPVVDVSIEPLDGDPTHSGASIARGVLQA